MILVDVNVLVYASIRHFAQHERCRDWLEARLSDGLPVGMPWHSVLGFMRIVTRPRVLTRPLASETVWGLVKSWLDLDCVFIPQLTERHGAVFGGLISGGKVSGNLIPDAHLAALAIEHGLTLCSTDGDFARFEGLRWFDPLRA